MLFAKMKKALQAMQARRAAARVRKYELKQKEALKKARWEYWVSTGIVKRQKKQN